MTKYIFLALLLISQITLGQTVLSSKGDMACTLENKTMQAGEYLVYKMYYNVGFVWIAAGEVTFQVHQRGSEFQLISRGYTYQKYDKFFKVRDYFESAIDSTTFLPRYFKREIEEGKYIRFDSISFDQKTHTVKEYFGKSRETAEEFQYALDHCVHDLLSIVYNLRNLDISNLSTGDRIPMDVFFDKELFQLSLIYEGEQKKKIKNLGKCKVKQFSPTLITGNVFTEDAKMHIYVSDDKIKIPLLIESPITVGSVKAILSEYNGLKYPIEAINLN